MIIHLQDTQVEELIVFYKLLHCFYLAEYVNLPTKTKKNRLMNLKRVNQIALKNPRKETQNKKDSIIL